MFRSTEWLRKIHSAYDTFVQREKAQALCPGEAWRRQGISSNVSLEMSVLLD